MANDHHKQQPLETSKEVQQQVQNAHPDDEGKLRNAAGQAWDSERLDGINDEDIEHLQVDQEVLRESGESKGKRKTGPHGEP